MHPFFNSSLTHEQYLQKAEEVERKHPYQGRDVQYLFSFSHPSVVTQVHVFKQTFGSDNPNDWCWEARTDDGERYNKLVSGIWFASYAHERNRQKLQQVVSFHINRKLS